MRKRYILAMVILLIGCSQSRAMKKPTPELLCSSKPNCVSTQEIRKDYSIPPFQLISPDTSLDDIERIALTLPRTSTVQKTENSLHLEAKSLILRFVDDLHITKQGNQLQVRSKSRVGYSDFGVNKSRTEALRQKLLEAKLIAPNTAVHH